MAILETANGWYRLHGFAPEQATLGDCEVGAVYYDCHGGEMNFIIHSGTQWRACHSEHATTAERDLQLIIQARIMDGNYDPHRKCDRLDDIEVLIENHKIADTRIVAPVKPKEPKVIIPIAIYLETLPDYGIF